MNNYKPLSRSESTFVTHDEDFIALADGQEGGWFDGCVEHMLRFLPAKVSRVSAPLLFIDIGSFQSRYA